MTPEQAVATVQADWEAAFAQRDPAALAALYTEDASFYGSAPGLSLGRAGVLQYFATLSPRYRGAQFGRAAVVTLVPGVVCACGPVTFLVTNGPPLRYRMTHVLVAQGAAWRIAVHHASPEPG